MKLIVYVCVDIYLNMKKHVFVISYLIIWSMNITLHDILETSYKIGGLELTKKLYVFVTV